MWGCPGHGLPGSPLPGPFSNCTRWHRTTAIRRDPHESGPRGAGERGCPWRTHPFRSPALHSLMRHECCFWAKSSQPAVGWSAADLLSDTCIPVMPGYLTTWQTASLLPLKNLNNLVLSLGLMNETCNQRDWKPYQAVALINPQAVFLVARICGL